MLEESDNEDIELDDYEMSADDEKSLLVPGSRRMAGATYKTDLKEKGEGSVQLDMQKVGNKEIQTSMFVYVLSFFSAIGGFLFGYDTGVVSGAMLLLKDKFTLSSFMEEVIVSVTIGFAFIFALVGGILNDKLGRKLTTVIASMVFTIGAGVLAGAFNVAMLVAGRAILGIGIGMRMSFVQLFFTFCH